MKKSTIAFVFAALSVSTFGCKKNTDTANPDETKTETPATGEETTPATDATAEPAAEGAGEEKPAEETPPA